MKMYRFFASLLLLLCVLASGAQEKNKNGFSPEKFRAEIEQFITKEACLTPKEASKFFPVYDEMNRKKRNIFDNMRKLSKRKPADDAGCREVIRKCDKMDLELKKIQQTYHEKFLSIIPASKLFDVIKAEEKFHRRMLNRAEWRQARSARATTLTRSLWQIIEEIGNDGLKISVCNRAYQ